MGRPGHGGARAKKRGQVMGWTAGAVRRHTRWLYSVDAPGLDGFGYALTLTVRDIPATSADWVAAVKRWCQWLRDNGALRWHWVCEWQRRGAPHLHLAVYFDHELGAVERARLVDAWLRAAPFGASDRGQTVTPITGVSGWLGYLSKHAARGVAHYQRQGMPEGWETTGRLWGKGGSWPTVDPVEGWISEAEFFRLRRLCRAWRVADARAAYADLLRRSETFPDAARRLPGARRRIVSARRMLRHSDPMLSRLRGVSEWIPEPVALRLLDVCRLSDVGPLDRPGRVRPAAVDRSPVRVASEGLEWSDVPLW